MRIKSPVVLKCFGASCGFLMWLSFKTIRDVTQLLGEPNAYDRDDAQPVIYSVWHDSIVMITFGGRHSNKVALTSPHQDGKLADAFVRFKGVRVVHGSSYQNGFRAAKRLMILANENDIVITPDGPRGPRRTLSRGIIYLASRSGSPIIPTAFACSNVWELQGNWTTLTIPKPFSKFVAICGQPIYVPNDISPREFGPYLAEVQSAMNSLNEKAKRLIDRRPT